jgi:asparagine synthase (glutamine-hydrolysing)
VRFVGLLARRGAAGQASRRAFTSGLARTGLARVVDAANGLVLFADKALVSSDGRIILGPAFDANGHAARREDLSGLDPEQLLTRYWGPCVAMAPASGTAGATYSRFNLARDPSGGMACYLALTPCGLYLTSDLALALRGGLGPPTIDWTMLAHDLAYRRARGARTCLSGVDELVPGTAASVGPETIETRLWWDPWRLPASQVASAPIEAAAGLLRSRVDLCTATLARGFQRPVLELSGGLDSSIVAAAMADRHNLSAVHCVSPGPEGDERVYARSIAQAFALPLEEHVLKVGRFDPGRVADPRLPRPGRPGVLGAAHRIVQAHCRARGADVVFTGAGGDSVFCALNTPAPAADRFWKEGPSLGFLRSLGDLSRRHNASFWTVARMTGRSIRRAYDPARGMTRRYLRAEALAAPQDLHPWLAAAPARAPLGKHLHVEAIAFILGYMEGQARMSSIPTIAPLLARPVLETCLSLPTWRWIEGGRDRAVARAAYRGRLPDLIIERRSKGAVDHYVNALLERNRAAVRSLLLDGLLARAGVLDSPAVEEALTALDDGRAADAHRLLELADAEAWARAWTAPASQALKAPLDDAPP